MKKFLFVLALLGVVSAGAEVIDVRVQGVAKQSLSLSGVKATGAGANSFLSTLKNDLLRSGWYRLILGSNAQVKVNGAVSGAASVAERLSVNWPGKRFAWERSAGSPEQVRKHAHALADAIVESTTGEKGIAQTRLAVIGMSGRSRNGQAIEDLYVCDYDGHNLKRLTTDNCPILAPRWSADKRSIYYTSYKLGYPAVFKVDVASGRSERLANFRGLSTGAVPSPKNANKLAIILSHQGNPELYIMDVPSRRLERMTNTPLAAEASPCWSPDGSQICYVSDEPGAPHLYVVDVATKKRRRLTFAGGENVQPDWSKSGIVFATKRGCPYRIAVLDPARGDSSMRYLTAKNEQFESPSWAPDGRHVVASRKQGKAQTIWILDAMEKGDEPYKPFSSNAGQWLNPAWSK